MMNILDRIVLQKKLDVAKYSENAREVFENAPLFNQARKPLANWFYQSASPAFITEFKRKSPSKADINIDANVADVVKDYENAGAAAISVLTDKQFFGGSLDDMEIARNTIKLPILRKDFIVDPIQVYEAKAYGADIILLIASALSINDAVKIAHTARKLGIEFMLEIHREKELCYLDIQPDFVGINSRNLRTFELDVQNSMQLVKKVPPGIPAIAASGINAPEEAAALYKSGFHGFLIGEHFMRLENRQEDVNQFIKKTNALCK